MDARFELLIDELYASVSEDLIDMIKNPLVPDFTTVLNVLCGVAAMVETLKIGARNMKGSEKKQVVVGLGRILLEKHSNEEIVDQVLEIYDASSIDAIEAIIHFAKNNKVFSKPKICMGSCW